MNYVGEVRMFAGNFAPAGWSFCDGSLLPIAEYDTLFNLIGTSYGGDGQSTFALPDLRGRVPVHQGNGVVLGETMGTEEVTLTVNQLPAHTHALSASPNLASTTTPGDRVAPGIGQAATIAAYGTDSPTVSMHQESSSAVGGSQPHNNLAPYVCVSFIISLFGVYPSQT